jgi:hypothetical protein
VFSVERIAALLEGARVRILRELRLRNVRMKHVDGREGLPEALKPGKNWELRCYDLQGKLWQQLPWPKGETSLNIDGRSWPPGLYLPVLFENNHPVATGKIIIQP